MVFRNLISIFFLLLLQSAVQAVTLHVFADGAGDYPTIQSAINASVHGDTVVLAQGVYTGSGNRGLNFNGKNIVVRGEGLPEEFVVDCEYMDVGFWFVSGETASAVLEFVTITHGENVRDGIGGGVVCEDSSPTLQNLRIVDNVGSHDAGIALDHSFSIIRDCLIQGNVASGSAGGAGIYRSSPLFHNVTFRNNTAHYQGGAIHCGVESSGEFIGCLFQGSYASQEGGAVHIGTGSTTNFTDCQFIDNQGKKGGAIYCGQAGSVIDNCMIVDNYAELSGGAIFFAYPPVANQPIVSSSIIYSNSGGAGGGGILATYGAVPILSQVTIVGNLGSDWNGAGISSASGSTVVIENSIVSLNMGPGLMRDSSSIIDVSCTDVFGNTGGDYTLYMQDQTGINGNISEDPLFCDYDSWVLTLAEQSPCLPENNDCGVLMGALGMDCTLTAVDGVPGLSVQLLPCFPNPFNPLTTVSLQLIEAAELDLAIFDVAGRRVMSLHEGWLDAGRHDLMWRGQDDAGREVPSGIYFVVLAGPTKHFSRKITLLR